MTNVLRESTELSADDGCSNVVHLEKWKLIKGLGSTQFSNYLAILSNPELFIEVRALVQEIGNNSYDKELIERGRAILDEFSKRLQSSSEHYLSSIEQMKSNLESRIAEIAALEKTVETEE